MECLRVSHFIIPSFGVMKKNSFNMTHIFIILFRSVPGPPASAYLKTLSSDSIQIDFSAPLNDGGTPINSYTVRLLENL